MTSRDLILEYLSQAELEKHEGTASRGASQSASRDASRGASRGGDGAFDGGGAGGLDGGRPSSGGLEEVVPEGARLAMPDGTAAGVVSLRRPLVERLRLTAATMDNAKDASIDALVASNLFDGQEAECGDDATTEVRQLLVALQDMTSARDQTRAELEAANARFAALDGGAEAEELAALRKQNEALRAENANMFTLMEENEGLRSEVQTLKLQLECRQQGGR